MEILQQLKQARRIKYKYREESSKVLDHPVPIFSITDRVIVANHVHVVKEKNGQSRQLTSYEYHHKEVQSILHYQ